MTENDQDIKTETADTAEKPKRKYNLRKQRPSKRQDIFDAAMRVFCHYGYDATTFQMIAQEAGVSTSLVVKFFKTKVTIVETCLQRFFQQFEDRIRRNMAQPDMTYEECIQSIFEFVKLNRAQWLFVQSFMMTPAHADITKKIQTDILSIGEDMTRHYGRCPEDKVEALNYTMIALYIAYFIGGDERRYMLARDEAFAHFLI